MVDVSNSAVRSTATQTVRCGGFLWLKTVAISLVSCSKAEVVECPCRKPRCSADGSRWLLVGSKRDSITGTGMSVVVNVMLSLTNVMSPPPDTLVRTVIKLYTLGVFAFGGEFGCLNCDVICMCVVNKQFDGLQTTQHTRGGSPNETAHTRCSCHIGLSNPVQIVSTPLAPAMMARFTFVF